ncbi:hypothetical protein CHELA1G11_14406 [Hyphomicrobiales bacterium]|nr:hypothetical protein CHELA1G11_14406 [Hyphomicrobiales bacterium]CAH1680412.1 hypothetical protein CHELA1G2_14699 [Hyphomicrobiales bacterium]
MMSNQPFSDFIWGDHNGGCAIQAVSPQAYAFLEAGALGKHESGRLFLIEDCIQEAFDTIDAAGLDLFFG